jgi:hypothetical protein
MPSDYLQEKIKRIVTDAAELFEQAQSPEQETSPNGRDPEPPCDFDKRAPDHFAAVNAEFDKRQEENRRSTRRWARERAINIEPPPRGNSAASAPAPNAIIRVVAGRP